MKHFIYLVSFVLLISCHTDKHKKVEYAIISGKITNPLSDKVVLKSKTRDYILESTLSVDGTFRDTVPQADGTYLFYAGNERTEMYLKNGYDVNIELDTKQFDETVFYKGKGAEVNNYQAKRYLLTETNLGDFKSYYALEEPTFLDKTDKHYQQLLNLLDSLPDQDFIAKTKGELNMEHSLAMVRYETYHGFVTENPDYRVSDSFPDPYKDLNLNDEELYKISSDYQAIVNTKFFDDIYKEAKDSVALFVQKGVEKLKTINKGSIKDGLVKDMLNYQDGFIFKQKNAEAKQLIGMVQDTGLKANLNEELAIVKNLKGGAKSPEFNDFENYKGGTTSLSDFKGKYLYIDVWATWCGPCKQEIPHMKSLIEQYKANPKIAFASISVDTQNNKDKWKVMVEEKEMKGVQLISDKDWKSDFVVRYNIKGIPRFILIDPEGKIVSDNAPRPSDPKLVKLFKEQGI